MYKLVKLHNYTADAVKLRYVKYFVLFSGIVYLTGLSCLLLFLRKNAVPAGGDFFHRQGGNISVTARAVCIGDLQEQIAQRAPFRGLQEHKCINVCTTSVRDGASYCLVVNRRS